MVITLLNIRITRADKTFSIEKDTKKESKFIQNILQCIHTVVSGKSFKFGSEVFQIFAWLEVCNEANVGKAF